MKASAARINALECRRGGNATTIRLSGRGLSLNRREVVDGTQLLVRLE
jgi:hypothetical protein